MTPDHFGNSIKGKQGAGVHILQQARAFLEAGREDKARDLVLKWRATAPRDAATCRGFAGICEELGMARQARELYEQALRSSPGDGEIHYRLASLLADVGHYEKSLHHLRKAVRLEPGHEAARKLLAEDYRMLGFSGLAEVLDPQPVGSEASSPIRTFPPSIGWRDVEGFLGLFSGREVGYAVQQVDPETGDMSCAYLDGPLTADLVASHLLGDITLEVYPLRADNTVRFVAVSVDVPLTIRKANIKNKGYLALLREKGKHHVLVLSRFARHLGLPAYAEENGDGGSRLWFFFETFIHFLKAKHFVSEFIRNAPQAESHLVVGPVLATTPSGLGWTENAVALPLGIHRGTLRRSFFVDDEGRTYGEQLKLLRRIRKLQPGKAADVLRELRGGGPFARSRGVELPAFVERLTRRCAVLRHLVRAALAGKLLRREEKVILFYTIGLVDPGGDVLHVVLSACPDYDYEAVKRQAARLKSNPVSCPKIRQMIPEVTVSVGCDCTLDLRGGKYPSPMLHINPDLVPAAEEFLSPENVPIKEVARRYVNLRHQQMELERAISRHEAVLDRHFRKKGIEKVKLEKSVLRRVDENGCTNWQIERV